MNIEIEQDIFKLKEIDHDAKVLKAKYDSIKKRLIEGFFSTYEEFVGSEGLVLATYKIQTRLVLDQKEFKTQFPLLHDKFLKAQNINVFSLKK